MSNLNPFSRRTFLKGASGAAALSALGVGLPSTGCLSAEEGDELLSDEAHPVGNGFGLTITQSGVFDGRLHYYRFATKEISWQPAVNVLLPEDYFQTSWRRYPVMYLLHGGAQDFRKFHAEDDIIGLTRGRRLIVVMPDGGTAGWYCNPVRSFIGARNWETFHINQLIPWIDANFRTYAEYDGRAVSGFSMGGFGALKYAAKYYGHFASVSSHSGPASLRRDVGAVVHWANVSAKFAELGGGSLYGDPLWDEGRVSADNPVERLASFGYHKRIFLVAGTAADINETFVLNGQREFRGLLASKGIPHEWHELPGAHFVRRDMLQRDIDGAIWRLKKA
jgi:S-formylglutathione hydrolase FrmB